MPVMVDCSAWSKTRCWKAWMALEMAMAVELALVIAVFVKLKTLRYPIAIHGKMITTET